MFERVLNTPLNYVNTLSSEAAIQIHRVHILQLLAENLLRRIFFHKIGAWQQATFSRYAVPSEIFSFEFW